MGKFRKGLEAKVSGLFRFFGKGIAHARIAHAKAAKVGKEDWLLEIGDRLLGRGLLTRTLLRS